MATKISTLYSLITADDKPFKRGLKTAEKTAISGAKKIQRAINRINFRAVAVGATALAGTYALATKKFIDLAVKQENAEKRLAAVIRATGQAAGYNIKQLKAMASAMQGVTTVGDETILEGMAMIATFKQIRGEAFERTTMAALDLSEVMQQDLRSSIVMIAKALNDPIANLGALGRAGIQFTVDQKKVIKSLWETGEVTKAQNMILEEMESQFGGAAKAARDTFGGSVKVLSNQLGDIGEKIGFKLMPPLQDMVQRFGDWVTKNDKLVSQDLPNWIANVGKAAGKTAEFLLKVNEQINRLLGTTGKSAKVIHLEQLQKREKALAEQLASIEAQGFEKGSETYKIFERRLDLVREKIAMVTKEVELKNQELEKTKTKIDNVAKAAEKLPDKIQMSFQQRLEDPKLRTPAQDYPEIEPFFDKLLMKEQQVFDDIGSNIENMKEGFETAAGSMQSAFADFARTGRLDFANMVSSMLSDLTRLATSKLFTTILGGIFNTGAGAAAAGAGGGTMEFQHGGYIGERVRGIGASGKSYEFHPNEYVTPAGKMGGGNVEVIVNNSTNAPAKVEENVGPNNTKRIMVWIGQDIMSRGPIHRAISKSFVVQSRGRIA